MTLESFTNSAAIGIACAWTVILMHRGFWPLFAMIVSSRPVFEWLKRRGARNPYTHLGAAHDRYMFRFWLFNPYGKDETGKVLPPRWPWLPSIRLHHIMRPDHDRHCHDHPWDFRTVVLNGYYDEIRQTTYGLDEFHIREPGDTATLRFGQFHRITAVSEGGVWTLFITRGYQGTWGFSVDGEKIPHHVYLADNPRNIPQ